jgi:hypothetical protein
MRRPLLRHLLLQLLAALLAWFFIAPAIQPQAWAILQGLFAVLLTYIWRMPGWQKISHGLFVPAVVLLQQLAVPAWVYLLGLLLTFALGRNALTERVPLYRSGREVADRLAAYLPPGARVLEAGCGDGRLAIQLAALRPDLHILALENAWGSCLLACLRWYFAGRPAGLRFGCRSFWGEHWGQHDAVYAFLSPTPMPRVWHKFLTEGAPASVLVSNTFTVPDVQPDSRIPLGGPLQKELLIWCHPHGSC